MAETARPTRRYLRDDRVALDAGKARAREESILGVGAGTLLVAYVVTMMIPAEFQVGIRLTPYTAFLLVIIIPLFLHFFRQVAEGTNRVVLLDLLMVGYVLLSGISILHNHGPGRIIFVINQTVSLFGGYMVGRILIRNADDYARFFRWFFYGLLAWFPFVMVELLTERMIVSEILALVSSPLPRAGNDPRLGLHRVQAFMEHAITFGLLCSVGVANSYYLLRDAGVIQRLGRTGFFAFMTFVSLSSAPNIAQGMQFLMIGWDRLLAGARYKWVLLVVVASATLSVLHLASPHGLVGLVIENLAFDPTTGWGRTEIFEYGSAEVARNPWLGLGLNDWIRPWYRKGSIDNFWLVTAMRYGLPAFVLLAGGILLHLVIVLTRRGLSDRMTDLRKGYLISWVGVIFILATVHIWGAGPLFIMAYLGAGSIFYTGSEAPARQVYRRRREIAAEGVASRQTPPMASGPENGPESRTPLRGAPTRGMPTRAVPARGGPTRGAPRLPARGAPTRGGAASEIDPGSASGITPRAASVRRPPTPAARVAAPRRPVASSGPTSGASSGVPPSEPPPAGPSAPPPAGGRLPGAPAFPATRPSSSKETDRFRR